MRRFLGAGVTIAMLFTGGVLAAGEAVAAGEPSFGFSGLGDKVLMPGEGWVQLSPSSPGGAEPDGTYVYVLSKKPLTDTGWWTAPRPSRRRRARWP